MNILRRLALARLLLLCAVVVAVGIGATALAMALGSGPTPPPKPLADAVHDALTAPPVTGVSARIQFTDHLLEGANLASAGGEAGKLTSSPLVTGASGRLWIAANGRVRLELQSDSGDTQILYDPGSRMLTLYDAAAGTLYRYQLPDGAEGSASSGSSASPGSSSSGSSQSSPADSHEIPTVGEIQEAIEHVMKHASLSGATPTDVAGQAAYSVRISPSHNGGLVGGAELAWDAVHGVPLRLAVYSTESSSPVLELTATEVSYGPVEESVFDISPPSNTKVTEVSAPDNASGNAGEQAHEHGREAPVTGTGAVQAALPFTLDAPRTLAGMPLGTVRLIHLDGKPAALLGYGEGLGGIMVLEGQAKTSAPSGSGESSSQELPAGLPQVKLPGADADELPTPLGTLLQFDRTGIGYLIAGSVTPATAEAAAKGL
jgi:hypothetical protein